MGFVSVQSVACPGSVLAGIFRWQICTPKGESFVLVLFVDFFEAAVVVCCDPAVVVVFVPDPDPELAILCSL